MNKIKDFKIDQVPVWKIIFSYTSQYSYEADRIYYCEDYPCHGDHTLVMGGHCSCYDFDATEFEAITYTRDEIKAVLSGWVTTGWSSEKRIAPLILNYLSD